MIRETKLGIVVACSFLALVGVVLASKLREDSPPKKRTQTIAAQSASLSTRPSREPIKKPDRPPVEINQPTRKRSWFQKLFDEQALTLDKKMVVQIPPPPPPGSSTTDVPPPSPGPSTDPLPPPVLPGGKIEITPPAPPKVTPPKVTPPKVTPPKVDLPKVELPKVTPPKVTPPKVEPPKVEPPKVTPPKVEPPKVTPPPPGAPPPPGSSLPDTPKLPKVKLPSVPPTPPTPPAPVTPKTPVAKPEKKKPVVKPAVRKPEVKKGTPTGGAPTVNNIKLVPPPTPTPTPPSVKVEPPKVTPTPRLPKVKMSQPLPPPGGSETEVTPPPPLGGDRIKPVPSTPIPPSPPAPPPSEVQPEPPKLSPTPIRKSEPPRTFPGESEASQPGGTRLNPSRLPVKETPVVVTFTEREYVCKTGDTYASIAKKEYMTDKYAEALRLYNRYDALVPRDRAPRDATLREGDLIVIPDLTALEARYSRFIAGYRPLPTTRSVRKTSTRSRNYLVSRAGQTMREIAREQLGDSERWREIRDLNPQYAPNYEIPGGQSVRLPLR